MALRRRPITLKAANAFVTELHRHHKADRGHKFSVSAVNGDELVGVAIVGRPKARGLDSGASIAIAEVTRMCTNGYKNACSFLYSVAARTCREMGYDKIITYVLETEPGTSLRAAGWTCDGVLRKDGKGWNSRPGRKRENQETKVRWSKAL